MPTYRRLFHPLCGFNRRCVERKPLLGMQRLRPAVCRARAADQNHRSCTRTIRKPETVMLLRCNIVPRNDGFNIGLKCAIQNCCMKQSVAVGVWCRYLMRPTERTFVYPCREHLADLLELPYDGTHGTWFELRGKIIPFHIPNFGGLVTDAEAGWNA